MIILIDHNFVDIHATSIRDLVFIGQLIFGWTFLSLTENQNKMNKTNWLKSESRFIIELDLFLSNPIQLTQNKYNVHSSYFFLYFGFDLYSSS